MSSSIAQLLLLVATYRNFILQSVAIGTFSAIIVSMLLPNWYKSTASVFPAEKADLLGGLDGISSLAKNLSPARALLGSNPEVDRYLAILKSSTVLGAVIKKFDLVNVYEITDYPGEKTAKQLLNNTEFNVEQEGNLTITVYDKDPQRAADIANFFVEMLNNANSELQVQNARGNRVFIEERYKKNLMDLSAAEDSLKGFQKKHGIVAMPEQTAASIKAGAELYAQLALREIQLGVLRKTQSEENPTVIAAQIEANELRSKLRKMSRGNSGSDGDMKLFVPFNEVPDLGTEYVRRFREVEIQYKILQFITPLYEQAKVEERRQTPSVIVLDRAFPAERKAKPKRSLIVLGGFSISLFVALAVLAFYSRWSIAKSTQSEFYTSAMTLIDSMKSSWLLRKSSH